MSFTDYILAIVRGTKTSLQAGLNAFFDAQKNSQIEYSKQAFSKGRQRIKPEAFQELYQAVVFKFYEKAELRSWRGYQLFGIDGTRLNLPCTKELEELYGSQTSQGAAQVQALVSCVYDLLNGIIADVRFAGCKSSERDAAQEMIQAFSIKNVSKAVFIMDRGYPSAKLINAIMQSGQKFVMRCSTEFLRAMRLSETDNIITYKFAKLKEPLKLRVVKLPLSEENVEYLVTNLYEEDISLDEFKWLYKQRWGIETKYDDIKNKLQIENFTGYSPDAVLQDFYATVFLANLAGVLEFELQDQVEAAHADPKNKHKYKLNMSMTISELKQSVVEMLAARSLLKRERLFLKITGRLQKAVVPVRPNRFVSHDKKHKSMRFPQNRKHI